MQIAITLMAVVAGMVFSLVVALLAEELIFGQVIRLFFIEKSSVRAGSLRTDGVQQVVTQQTHQKR